MLFGIPEIKEFAENHEDIRVRIIYKKLCEARSKNARWLEALNKANETIALLTNERKTINDKIRDES